MDRLEMHSPDKVDENIVKIGNLFPNCITETLDDNGRPVKAIDFDMLKQELSKVVVDGPKERYQFTWPDKKKSMLLANSPISATLRPCRLESVNFDKTENLYIEGDNLDVLKLLQETYLGKVKMIYIDPPYNINATNIYKDDYSQNASIFLQLDGQYDEHGNRMTTNFDSNGRFHTDWLNMLYSRLRLARDLLVNDGIIMISIDDSGNENLLKICNEIFGEHNFVGNIAWESKTKSQNTKTAYNKLQPKIEYILVYTKGDGRRFHLINKGLKEYPFSDEQGEFREYPLEVMNATGIRGRETMIYDVSDGVSIVSPPEGKQWQLGQAQVAIYQETGNLIIRDAKVIIKMRPEFERQETTDPFWGFFSKDIGTAESAKKELTALFDIDNIFDTVKPTELIKRLLFHVSDSNSVILDFFSGSATTAHAVMQLNAEDGGKRKFIMVQIPEATDETSEAFKAGYKNICEIGKERIRRAGKKILEENKAKPDIKNLDIGFRVLKLDSSNMKNVYYTPEEYVNDPGLFDQVHDNIKEDRNGEDLLFQVMLDLGIELSADIRTETIAGKNIYSVKDNYLIACFDNDVNDELITEIAKRKPFYAVLRDKSFTRDDTASNFEQIFATWSPETIKKVL